jgi:predicted PurR-regulated permease PerM
MPESRRSVRASDLIVALLFATGLYAAWIVRSILLLIYVSIIFAIALTPAVKAICRIRIRNWSPSRGVAILLLGMAVLAVVALFFALALPPIIQNVQDLGQELPNHMSQIADRVQQFPMGKQLAPMLDPHTLQQHMTAFLKNVFGTLQAFFAGVTSLLLLAILTAYFILDGRRSFDWAISLAPADERARLRSTMLRGSRRVQRWILGQLLLMLILGSYSFVLFLILKVRYFYALALFAGVANIIPILGPIISVVVAGVVAAIDSWVKLVGVVVGYLIYQQVENAYLSPRIMESTVKISAVAVVVALAIGGELAGILGALVAVPSAALVSTLIDEYWVNREKSQAEYRKAS